MILNYLALTKSAVDQESGVIIKVQIAVEEPHAPTEYAAVDWHTRTTCGRRSIVAYCIGPTVEIVLININC
jgi:hypothetical protein